MSYRVGSRDSRLKSKGCLSCIRMKVKCDETKPHCQRCQRARRKCPGYRDQTGFTFRLENGSGKLSAGSTTINTQKVLVSRNCLALPLPTDWCSVAVTRFFHHFVLASSDPYPGYFEFLPHLYRRNYSKSLYLRKAVEAISMASLAQVNQMGDFYLREARKAYGCALHGLNIALGCGSESGRSAVLATVYLLWKYCIVMGEDDLNNRSPHREGQREVLRMRLSRNLDARDERWINRSVLASVQMQHLGSPAAESHNMPLSKSILPAKNPASLLVDNLLPQITTICGAVSSLDLDTSTAEKVAAYSGQLQHIQQQLRTWEHGLPREWIYKVTPNPLAGGQTTFPSTTIILPSIHTASTWIAYWLARMSVLRSMATLAPHQLSFHLPAPPLSEIREDMGSVASSICASVPYMLGNIGADGRATPNGEGLGIGALFATRALFISAQLPDLPDSQMDWILDRLSYVAQISGIRQALVLKEEILRNRLVT